MIWVGGARKLVFHPAEKTDMTQGERAIRAIARLNPRLTVALKAISLTRPFNLTTEHRMSISLNVNGRKRTSAATPDTPLLYVLRNDMGINSAKYGCGVAQCGSCTVLLDGKPIRSCVYPASSASKGKVTTLEGLGTTDKLHVLQKAFIEEQAAQCGFCISGMIMSAKALLDRVRSPSEAEIREALAGNLCRCGTHTRILGAIQRAAKELA